MNRILLSLLLFFSVAASAQRLIKPMQVTPSAGKTTKSPSLQTNGTTTSQSWVEKEAYVNGYARVLSNDKFSFIDKTGRPISSVEFEDARNFVNNFAAVKKNSKWGFINEVGRVVVPCEYEIVYDFKEPVTAVFKNAKWYLIHKNATVVKELDITAFFGFINGKAKVIRDGHTGSVDTAGIITFTGEFVSQPITRTPAAFSTVNGQCPDNIDFENGNFNNWNCFTGSVDSIGNINVITVTPSTALATRHKIINRTIPSAIDAYGLFPLNPPDGSNYAVKLGNTRIGAEAERIQYVIRIPANDSNFSIRYDYAVVFQDPGHTQWTQPRFTAKLFDSTAHAYIECASFEYISTSSLPGFETSAIDTSVIFKPWASAFISLRGHAGQTLYLEFTTADCVRRGHWGYAYVDVETTCSHAVDVNYECVTGIADLSAPPGFQTYNWWNQDYSAIIGNGQHVTLNPAPANNSTIWLEMVPFSDFGCRDSMPVTFQSTFTPHFDVSETTGICAPHLFTFYNDNIPATSASWNFGDGQTANGDTISHTYTSPGTYIVTLTVTLASGCTGTYQDTVTVLQPSGSFNYVGTNACNSATIQFNATTSNTDSLVYNFGDGNIITSNLSDIAHTYSAAGIYVATLTLMSNQGCNILLPGTDTIKVEILQPQFSTLEHRSCGNTVVDFKDISQSYFGITGYSWNFGDGSTGYGSTISHTYTASGSYTIQLVITGVSGCLDSIIRPITVVVNNGPAASIAGPVTVCTNVPVAFIGTTQPAGAGNSLEWSSSNGAMSSANNNYSLSFAQTGIYTIQLIATSINGCADTATHQITIEPVPSVNLPGPIQVCSGVQVIPAAFTGSLSGIMYAWSNDDPSIGLAANGTGNLPFFTSSNLNVTTTVANITVVPSLNGCTGNVRTFTISVLPLPTVFQPVDQTVCNRGTTDEVQFNSITAVVASSNYSWTNNQPSIGLPATGTGDIPSFTAINTGTLPVIATITIAVTNNSCSGVSQTFNITVYPTPDLSPLTGQVVCNGANTNSVLFESAASNATYTWTNDQPSIGLPATGTDSIAFFTAFNNVATPIIANIAVSSLANGCHGTPASFSILVNPTPVMAQPSDQNLCTGQPTTMVDFTGTVTGTVFNWTNNVPSIGLPANGTGNLLSFNPNNSSNTNLVATIEVTPVANGCPGIPKIFSIIIFPTPAVVQPLNQFQCNGETTAAINFLSPVAGTTFSWTNSLPSVGLPANGIGNIPAFITYNPTNTTISAAITVTPSTNDCPGIPKTFYLSIDPTPTISQPVNQILCNGATAYASTFSGSVSGTTYSWINSEIAIGLAAGGNGDIPSFTATNTTNFPITAVIRVTGSANSCGSAVTVFTITVNPSPAIDAPDDKIICNGVATTAIPLTGPVSGTAFSWTNNTPAIGLAATVNGDIPSFMAINHTSNPIVATILISAINTACGTVSESITITVNPSAAVVANHQENVCLGNSVQLTASGAAQYSWTPAIGLSCVNCANPFATPTDSVMYTVNALSALGCSGRDSVLLAVIKPFTMRMPAGDTICSGRSAHLNAANANSYLWSPPTGLDHANIASPAATPATTTQYQVIGYDAFHCFTDTGYVTIVVGPQPSVNIGADLNTVNGTPTTFHPVIQNGPVTQYTWTPATELSCSDCPSPTAVIHNNIVYTLRVVNSFGCSAVDSIFVTAMCQKAEVFVPNAFTPDGDGLNDVLMIRGSGIRIKSFRVFNRWGVMIFERQNFNPNDIKYGWDGKVRAVAATPDVYIYT
ncbi:MAG: PKD domain-containing protein, partial [Ferruginibacter sp.]